VFDAGYLSLSNVFLRSKLIIIQVGTLALEVDRWLAHSNPQALACQASD